MGHQTIQFSRGLCTPLVGRWSRLFSATSTGSYHHTISRGYFVSPKSEISWDEDLDNQRCNALILIGTFVNEFGQEAWAHNRAIIRRVGVIPTVSPLISGGGCR